MSQALLTPMVRARIMRDCWTGLYEILFVGLDTGIVHNRQGGLTLDAATKLAENAGTYVGEEARAMRRGESRSLTQWHT